MPRVRDAFPILQVADLERSLAFYRDRLGFAVEYEFDGFAQLAVEGGKLGLAGTDERVESASTGDLGLHRRRRRAVRGADGCRRRRGGRAGRPAVGRGCLSVGDPDGRRDLGAPVQRAYSGQPATGSSRAGRVAPWKRHGRTPDLSRRPRQPRRRNVPAPLDPARAESSRSSAPRATARSCRRSGSTARSRCATSGAARHPASRACRSSSTVLNALLARPALEARGPRAAVRGDPGASPTRPTTCWGRGPRRRTPTGPATSPAATRAPWPT